MYFARPDSILDGVDVYAAQLKMGEKLAAKVQKILGDRPPPDVVIAVPDTSRPIALQCAASLGCLYREGFIKNRYIGRTFSSPRGNPTARQSPLGATRPWNIHEAPAAATRPRNIHEAPAAAPRPGLGRSSKAPAAAPRPGLGRSSKALAAAPRPGLGRSSKAPAAAPRPGLGGHVDLERRQNFAEMLRHTPGSHTGSSCPAKTNGARASARN